LAILLSGCGFNIDPTTAPEMNRPVVEFLTAVDNHQMDEAWNFLTPDVQKKLDRVRFVSAGSDFSHILVLFSQAGIITRALSPKTEFPVTVKDFNGNQGIVRFVMRQENGKWLIANLLPEPSR